MNNKNIYFEISTFIQQYLHNIYTIFLHYLFDIYILKDATEYSCKFNARVRWPGLVHPRDF